MQIESYKINNDLNILENFETYLINMQANPANCRISLVRFFTRSPRFIIEVFVVFLKPSVNYG